AELEAVRRGLPHNPTTEMDLELWALAQKARADADAARALAETPPAQLAERYCRGELPPALQAELGAFLARYGHRGVAEIDLGLPRWSDDPTHIVGVLANYLLHADAAAAPDVQFRRAVAEAEAAMAELTRRARARDPIRGRLIGLLLRRTREL